MADVCIWNKAWFYQIDEGCENLIKLKNSIEAENGVAPSVL